VENIKALLDSPGEWYFDKRNAELSFIPPLGIDNPDELLCIVPTLDQLMVIKGNREKPVRNLRFYGLNFQGVNDGNSAIQFVYAHNCELVDGELSAMAGQAVYLGSGCYQNKILSNRITDIAEGAVIVDGQAHPEYWMDIIRETVISYNYLENTGGNSISAHNCLNTIISHNEITNNHGRTAIYVGGWRNLEEAIDGGYRVEYNHVHHVQSHADDSGAITTAGMTYDSVVRYNLIHHVKAGYFNNNVAIWFDNMSLGWKAENNILYSLEQDDMKLCACNLVDNLYKGNFHIEAPLNEPEGILSGQPDFTFSDLQVVNTVTGSAEALKTGDYIRVSAQVNNHGATGISEAVLYVDGKMEKSKKFPVIKNNTRIINFETRFTEPGEHRVAISDTPYRTIMIEGERPPALFDSLQISSHYLPAGDTLKIDVQVTNVQKNNTQVSVPLLINEVLAASNQINLLPGNTEWLHFSKVLAVGQYRISIGNTPPVMVEVYPHTDLDIASAKLAEYCSGTAKPCNFQVDQKKNHFILETAGTDFMHGEDSYGSVYFEQPVRGNFVATVKLKRFGKRTHQWFRAGLFVRNDMRKSFDTGDPSLGSVLWFVTPGRVGMNWDRFGNGAMHWASSENHPLVDSYPMWLKLVRHGNSFSGYVSYDGKHWTVERHTEVIPGLAGAVHLGLAAGSCDESSYTAEFEDLQVTVEKQGWK
jgi:regulation of enolase protein 1 (concanavalin A-like superfamily)